MAFSFEFDQLLCKLQKRIYFVCWNKNFIGDLKSEVNFAQYREYRSIFLQRLCSSPSITLFYRLTSFCIKNETSIDHIIEIINNTRVTCKAKLNPTDLNVVFRSIPCPFSTEYTFFTEYTFSSYRNLTLRKYINVYDN